MSSLKSPINALAEKLGLGALTFEEGMCSIQFDAHVFNFHVDEVQSELLCFLRVIDIPQDPEKRLALYRRLLITSAFGRGAGGGHLGVDETEAFVVFSRAVPAEGLSVDRLELIVELMLDMVESFQREWVEDAAPENAGPPAGIRV
ncbi:MAG: type III secretion system chaperone [Planctomycetes bacterium]|nr:type III secretion system chaperone [Planctomycetota bacterium]